MNEQNQKSWMGRNWPWALPVGCCSGCLILIVVVVFGVGTAVFGIIDELAEVSPIEEAINIAEKNDKILEYIGKDIETEGFPNGKISIKNDEGDVDFRIQIIGNRGVGTLVVRGIRSDKKWVYEDLYVIIKESGERINLLENRKLLEEGI
ncbi:cytochrome c oxidase assembly factor Coa1 family protein [Tenacibaculum amylolyticum]|uniref:cytochrome c oxidase assembly factor Coa1 family protein n=1 Tax=Tenacibaculum amylolyticum TaxID=104269 RepID=UPI0038965EFB